MFKLAHNLWPNDFESKGDLMPAVRNSCDSKEVPSERHRVDNGCLGFASEGKNEQPSHPQDQSRAAGSTLNVDADTFRPNVSYFGKADAILRPEHPAGDEP